MTTTAVVNKVATPAPFTVLNVVLDSGERLPCLVESATWLPVRVATRWAVRYRRYRVQSSTLANNLRVLARVYRWARENAGYDLDNHLTQGQSLRNREIESLVSTLRASSDGHALDTGAFDQHVAVIDDFLKWSLDGENRGGRTVLSLEQLTAERGRLEQLFRSLRVGARPSARIEALELGIRRGELLKLRLDSLPRAAEDGVRILRRPDDPHDSRAREPAVKTAERVIPASRELLRTVQVYLTSPPPLGRVTGKSPYLFVTRSGNPVSIDTADDIIVAIGRFSGVTPLSWHRLRHTWAERMAELFADQPNGMDRLVYLGGWTNPLSARRYIQRSLAKQAKEALRGYHRKLYEEAGNAAHRP